MTRVKFFIPFVVVILVLIITLTLGIVFAQNKGFFDDTNDETAQKISFSKLELADEPNEQAQGLMNRTELCKECGMLFVFTDNAPRSFWMKNTLIPLDIIFIDEQGKVLNIEQAKPLQEYPTYNSQGNAKYVLEINAQASKDMGIKPGVMVDMKHLLQQAQNFEWIQSS